MSDVKNSVEVRRSAEGRKVEVTLGANALAKLNEGHVVDLAIGSDDVDWTPGDATEDGLDEVVSVRITRHVDA